MPFEKRTMEQMVVIDYGLWTKITGMWSFGGRSKRTRLALATAVARKADGAGCMALLIPIPPLPTSSDT